MLVSLNFTDGYIADNILQCLRNLSDKEILQLAKDGAFSSKSKIMKILNYRRLRFESLTVYADACQVPLCYFIFGTMQPPVPTYTQYDGLVIAMLNTLPEEKMKRLYRATKLFFYTGWDSFADPDPCVRIVEFLKSKPFGYVCKIEYPPFKQIKTDIATEINMLRQKHYNPNTNFTTDCLPDLATYLGISLHWVLNIKDYPLYCNSPLGDDIFDLYTMLQPAQQISFLRIAGSICTLP